VSTREVTAGLSPAVIAAGPPPAPMVAAPWSIRGLTAEGPDPALVSRWMNEPHVALFWDQAWPAERWAATLRAQLSGDCTRPFLVSRAGKPFAYVEIYRTPRDVVGRQYDADPYDLGIHLAIGELGATGKGLGRAMVRAVALGLKSADPRVRKLVADPDERHVIARRMFRGAGFHDLGVRDLGHKRAALLVRDLTGEG
jgi:RimJ/RimL family protein N-acetyltransferase